MARYFYHYGPVEVMLSTHGYYAVWPSWWLRPRHGRPRSLARGTSRALGFCYGLANYDDPPRSDILEVPKGAFREDCDGLWPEPDFSLRTYFRVFALVWFDLLQKLTGRRYLPAIRGATERP